MTEKIITRLFRRQIILDNENNLIFPDKILNKAICDVRTELIEEVKKHIEIEVKNYTIKKGKREIVLGKSVEGTICF